MNTVYGPVPSWRLGRSLGIDPILPPKTCTFDCIYCQLGKTRNKVGITEDYKPKVKVENVVKDFKEKIREIDLKTVDYITFSGTGEPTLNPFIGKMVEKLRELVEGIPFAILTNSSLIFREDIKRALCNFDLVAAKLDAPSQELFERINRPAKGLKLKMIIENLKLLRREMHGKLALQIMFLKTSDGNMLNSRAEVVEKLVEITNEIGPDEVQINTPYRPPSESYVKPLTNEELMAITDIFKRNTSGIEVHSRLFPRKLRKTKVEAETLEVVIIELLKRRPCKIKDITDSLGIPESEVRKCLDSLHAKGLVKLVKYKGDSYYIHV